MTQVSQGSAASDLRERLVAFQQLGSVADVSRWSAETGRVRGPKNILQKAGSFIARAGGPYQRRGSQKGTLAWEWSLGGGQKGAPGKLSQHSPAVRPWEEWEAPCGKGCAPVVFFLT